MEYKYGEFTTKQIAEIKKTMRHKIYFLLLYVDPKTKGEYANVDIEAAFHGILTDFGGLNSILCEPPELVEVIATLEAARLELHKDGFDFPTYRKLVLGAGAKVLEIKEV